MPLLGLFLLFVYDPYLRMFAASEAKFSLFMVFAINTVAIPGLSFLILVRSKMVSSIDMAGRKERFLPFGLTLMYYGLTYYLIYGKGVPEIVMSLLIGVMVALVVITLITLKWKVSIHMLGVGGLVGGMMALSQLNGLNYNHIIALIIFMAGLVGTSRLVLKAHEPFEVYLGFVIGLVCEYCALRYEWVI